LRTAKAGRKQAATVTARRRAKSPRREERTPIEFAFLKTIAKSRAAASRNSRFHYREHDKDKWDDYIVKRTAETAFLILARL
jgi:hypothetical protein